MIREILANKLQAILTSTYQSGHMGAEILRFERLADQTMLVAKVVKVADQQAMGDLSANISGYNKLKRIGAGQIIPPDLELVETEGYRVLVMRDLGMPLTQVNSGLEACREMWLGYPKLVFRTMEGTAFVGQVCRNIGKYCRNFDVDIAGRITAFDWPKKFPKAGLMLLDFTPDNVFCTEQGAYFIDPWDQASFLGHPAVSLGQFSQLMRIYGMKQAEECREYLLGLSLGEITQLLGCDRELSRLAFCLGETLQLVLSAYVRRENDTATAEGFIRQALDKWPTV